MKWNRRIVIQRYNRGQHARGYYYCKHFHEGFTNFIVGEFGQALYFYRGCKSNDVYYLPGHYFNNW